MKLGSITLVGEDAGAFSHSQLQYLGRVIGFRELTPYSVYSKCPAGDDSLVTHWAFNGIEEDRGGIANVLTTRFKDLKPGEAKHGAPTTGTHIFYKENGDMDVTVINDQNVNIKGNGTINVSGNVTINVTGTTTIVSGGNINITAPLTTINGAFTVTGATTLEGKSFLTHGHAGSPTAPNGPVTNTGVVV